jgi:hypothetical protein
MENRSFFTNLCLFISPKEKLELFDLLCENYGKLRSARLVERISMELNMKRPNVYRYMKTRKKRVVPSEQTTAKVIELLLAYGRSQAVLPFLKRGSERMLVAAKSYNRWVRNREAANSPFSDAELQRLQRSLLPNLLADAKRVSF